MSLRELLVLVISGAAGGPISYWLMEKVKWLAGLPAEYKRYISLAIAAALPVLAWLVVLGMGYEPAPATWQGWIEQVFYLAGGGLLAVLGGQTLHGRLKLRV